MEGYKWIQFFVKVKGDPIQYECHGAIVEDCFTYMETQGVNRGQVEWIRVGGQMVYPRV